MSLQFPELNYLPRIPDNIGLGIGLIGAGYIAEIGHIPAFLEAVYNITAAADLSEERREYCRKMAGIDKVFSDYRSLLELPDIQIVDITVPQSSPNKIQIIHDAIDAGKNILVEKPLAMDYQEAKMVVQHAHRAGIKLAVCHQYRWMPVFRVIKNLIDQGYLGELFLLSMDERRSYDYPEKYYNNQPRWLLFMDAIHFVDQFRWWTCQEPNRVFASLSRRPGQYAKGEMLGTLVMEFEEELQATYVACDATHPQSQYHHIRIEGTEGVINAKFDDLFVAGELEYSSTESQSFWYRPSLEGKAFTNGFIGLMGNLIEAVTEGKEPEVSGTDNLKTLQIILAGYKSDESNRTVVPAEIDTSNK